MKSGPINVDYIRQFSPIKIENAETRNKCISPKTMFSIQKSREHDVRSPSKTLEDAQGKNAYLPKLKKKLCLLAQLAIDACGVKIEVRPGGQLMLFCRHVLLTPLLFYSQNPIYALLIVMGVSKVCSRNDNKLFSFLYSAFYCHNSLR